MVYKIEFISDIRKRYKSDSECGRALGIRNNQVARLIDSSAVIINGELYIKATCKIDYKE